MRFVGIVLVICAIPVLVAIIRSGATQRRLSYVVIGLLPFAITALNLDAALIDWTSWPGYSKGVIITLLDALAIAILITHPRPRIPIWLVGLIGLYIAAAALSIAFAGQKIAAAFYVFQLARIALVLAAVAAVASQTAGARLIGMGLAIGVSIQAISAIYQHLNGVLQASGTMSHQNLLGMMTHFTLIPLLGLLLAGDRTKSTKIGIAASLAVIALGGSRATIAFAGAGVALLLVLSMLRRPTGRKLRILGGGVLALALAGVIAVGTLAGRSDKLNFSGPDLEREAFNRAARMIIADHPMGVGANQYVQVANVGGYSSRAGVIWNSGSRSANVHNLYLLSAAELGIHGAVLIVLLLVGLILAQFSYAWGNRRDPTGEVHMSIAVAVAVVMVHSLFEWVFVTSEVQYVFAISVGLGAGLRAAQVRERAEARRHRRRDNGGPRHNGSRPAGTHQLS